jgi:acetylornithine/N-succinyldiaminopimelate aminotransferase
MIGNPLDLPGDEFRWDFFYLPGRDSAIDSSGFDPRAFQYHRSRRDDRVRPDDRIIHDNSAHSDQHPILDRATMNDGVMTDRHIIPDMDPGLLIGGMDDHPVLDIYLVTDMDTANVSPYDGVEPDAAMISDFHFAYDSGIRGDETTIAKARGFAFYGQNNCHGFFLQIYELCYTMNGNLSEARRMFLRHLAQTSPNPLGLEIERAEGLYLYDTSGKAYLDLIGGISVANTGHRHPTVIRAIRDQLDRYLHVMVYGEFIQSPQVQYAAMLAANLPLSLNTVYFTNSGTEATEGAMKLAKRVTGRTEILAFHKSYHGSTQGALSVMGDEYWRNAFRPLLPGILHEEYNSASALDAISARTACVIAETIQAESGVHAPGGEWLKQLRQKCHETGALLILDEIQVGFGRTGTLWGFERFGVVPDILLLGKALGGGMPMGAFIADQSRMASLTDRPVLGHITTFGGHPVCCAAGMASMQVLLQNGWIGEVERKERLFRQLLLHPAIRAVRSCGLLIAVEFADFDQNKRIIDACIGKGVLTDWFLFAPECLRIAPPLTITDEQIHSACDILLAAIRNS